MRVTNLSVGWAVVLGAFIATATVPGTSAQTSNDDYAAGVNAGQDAARQSGDVLSLPFEVLPEPSISKKDNPALRGSDWRNGYRDGYDQGEQENREHMCAYGLSPFPCR